MFFWCYSYMQFTIHILHPLIFCRCLYLLNPPPNEGFFSCLLMNWFSWVVFANCRFCRCSPWYLFISFPSVMMSTSLTQEILPISPQYTTHLFSVRLELTEELLVSFSAVSSFAAPILFEWVDQTIIFFSLFFVLLAHHILSNSSRCSFCYL